VKNSLLFLFLSIALFSSQGYCQKLLEKKINLEVQNSTLENLLLDIQNQGNFYFVYNPNDFSPDSLVNVHIVNSSVKQVLGGLFQDEFTFKEYGQHVLIFKKRGGPGKSKDKRIITGYLVNVETREAIGLASISELDRLGSALTDANGYYELEIPSDLESIALAISKVGFSDTVLVIDAKSNVLDVAIRPTDVQEYFETLDRYGMVRLMTTSSHLTHGMNYSQSIHRVAQISFVPYLGTNRHLSGVATNNISINVLAGYSYATRGIEIGGLSNIDRYGFSGVQIGGLTNYCGKQANGLQIGGILNIVTGDMSGVQIGGINNNVHGDLNGLQIGGINNIVTGSGRGLQLAGVSNFSTRDHRGSQIGGVLNFAQNNKKLQLAGVLNVSWKDNAGVQIAGVLNVAKKLSGLQVGLVNYADTASGIPVGLFSFVRKGFLSVGLVMDEALFSNFVFKTGVPAFHNIFQASADPTRSVYSYGLGFGSRLVKTIKSSVHLDLTANQVNEGEFADNLNLLSVLRLSYHRNWGRLALSLGPDAKLMISQWTSPEGEFLTTLSSYQIYENISGSTLTQFWIGGHIGLHYQFGG